MTSPLDDLVVRFSFQVFVGVTIRMSFSIVVQLRNKNSRKSGPRTQCPTARVVHRAISGFFWRTPQVLDLFLAG